MTKITTTTSFKTTDGREFLNIKMAEAWQKYVDACAVAEEIYNDEFNAINGQLFKEFEKGFK